MKKLLLIFISFQLAGYQKDFYTNRPVTIAILAKDKAHCLPLYLACIEKQTWPASKTYLYIRTNNNNDNTAQILKDWILKVKDRYLGIYFNATDVPEKVEQYGQHEWNYERLKVLGKIRGDSIEWAYANNSHYFVADCDNFIYPHTIETMLESNRPIIAPLVIGSDGLYGNYHADIDENGYCKASPLHWAFRNQEIKGLIQLPVVHCTYLVRYEVLDQMSYDDESWRYEYVIFSDTARKKGIPQYLDTTELYGHVTFAENATALVTEPWFIDFSKYIYSFKK